MSDFGMFCIAGTDRTFKIDYAEGMLIAGAKRIPFQARWVDDTRFCETADFTITGKDWMVRYEMDEGNYCHLCFMEKGINVELELIDGLWPEEYL